MRKLWQQLASVLVPFATHRVAILSIASGSAGSDGTCAQRERADLRLSRSDTTVGTSVRVQGSVYNDEDRRRRREKECECERE